MFGLSGWNKKIIDKLPIFNPDGVYTKKIRNVIYNRLEGNSNISNKKQLFLNLMEFYKMTNQDPQENIPLTFLVKGGPKDESYEEFLKYASLDLSSTKTDSEGSIIYYYTF